MTSDHLTASAFSCITCLALLKLFFTATLFFPSSALYFSFFFFFFLYFLFHCLLFSHNVSEKCRLLGKCSVDALSSVSAYVLTRQEHTPWIRSGSPSGDVLTDAGILYYYYCPQQNTNCLCSEKKKKVMCVKINLGHPNGCL